MDDDKHIRLIVNVINQIPLSVGVLLGAQGVGFLRALFGAGLFLAPVVFYFWCLVLSARARDFSVFVCALVSLVVFAIPSEIFVVNQALTALAICWVLAHYALLPLKPRRLELLLIVVLGVTLFRAHESMIFWGWGLCFAAFAGMRRENCFRLNVTNWYRYCIAIAGVSSSLFVVWWQISHPVGQQTDAYLKLLALLKPHEFLQGNTRISALVLLALAMIYISRSLHDRFAGLGKFFRLIAVLAGAYAVIFAFSAFRLPELANPFREFEYRFLITFGGAGVLLLAPYVRLGDVMAKSQSVSLVVSSGLLAATIWQFSNDVKWDAFRRASIRSIEYSEAVIVPPSTVYDKLESVGQGYLYQYRWDWTWPVFGLSLHESREVLKMFRPEGYEQYFVLPKAIGEGVHVPFMQMGPHGYFDLTFLTQACIAGHCQ